MDNCYIVDCWGKTAIIPCILKIYPTLDEALYYVHHTFALGWNVRELKNKYYDGMLILVTSNGEVIRIIERHVGD